MSRVAELSCYPGVKHSSQIYLPVESGVKPAMRKPSIIQGSFWTRFSPSLTLPLLTFFVAASLWAKWNPVQAQDVPDKKEPTKKQNATPRAAKTSSTPGNIPGRGQKLDATALAKII